MPLVYLAAAVALAVLLFSSGDSPPSAPASPTPSPSRPRPPAAEPGMMTVVLKPGMAGDTETATSAVNAVADYYGIMLQVVSATDISSLGVGFGYGFSQWSVLTSISPSDVDVARQLFLQSPLVESVA